MKRILSLAIAVIMLALSLVSCENNDWDDTYPYTPQVTKDISLNMYIICEDDCDDSALKTAANAIADYTKREFKTEVKVIYKKASEYLASVRAAVSSTDDDKKAGIVLVNSKSLMDELMTGLANGQEKLLDLTDLYKKRDFGTLNKQINSALLSASQIITTPDNPNTSTNEEIKKIFTVPNNRVLGEYTYLVIDKRVANEKFVSTEKIQSLNSLEDALAIQNLPEDAIEVVSGSYEKRFEYGSNYLYEEDPKVINGSAKYCCVIEKPTVTAEDAFESAFAIVKGGAISKKADVTVTDTEFAYRAMEIIYAINNDVTLRNLLQYGRDESNYTIASGSYDKDGNLVADNGGDYDKIEDASVPGGFAIVPNGTIIPEVNGSSFYHMNLEYTGDVFKAGYSYYVGSGYLWCKEFAANGVEQNKDVSYSK